MDELSQIEIAKFLYDYSMLTQLMVSNKNKKIKDLFFEYLKYEDRMENANDEYFIKTLKIAYIFTMLKSYSIGEDYTLKQKNNFINGNNSLLRSALNHIRTKIIGDLSSVNEKEILQLIRNGFNHTTNENELYKISADCNKITFSRLIKTPLKIPINISELKDLSNTIEDTAQTFNFFYFNKPEVTSIEEYIKEFEITRICFTKKIDDNVKNEFSNLYKQGKYEEAKDYLLANSNYEIKEILLEQYQRKLIEKYIKIALENNLITEEELKENVEKIITILLKKILPIPAMKNDYYQIDSVLLNFAFQTDFSYNDLCSLSKLTLSPSDNNSKYGQKTDNEFYYTFNDYIMNDNEKITYATLLYVEYVLSVFGNNEDEIIINDKPFKIQQLRNSLVHGRWFINNNTISFFDAKPQITSETDCKLICELKLIDLVNYCSNILDNKIINEKDKTFIKTKKSI